MAGIRASMFLNRYLKAKHWAPAYSQALLTMSLSYVLSLLYVNRFSLEVGYGIYVVLGFNSVVTTQLPAPKKLAS